MMSSVIPARLEFQCGHAALVSLPRIKNESTAQRNERIAREKRNAQSRQCDFCGPRDVVVEVPAQPSLELAHNGSSNGSTNGSNGHHTGVVESELAVEALGTVEPVASSEPELVANELTTPPAPSEAEPAPVATEAPSDGGVAPVVTSEPPVRRRRGRPPGTKRTPTPTAPVASNTAPVEAAAPVAERAPGEPSQPAPRRRGRPPVVKQTSPLSVSDDTARAGSGQPSSGSHAFQVRFIVAQTVSATSVAEALRLAQAQGAAEVLEIKLEQ